MYFESFWSIPNCLQFVISTLYNLFKFIDAQNEFTIFSNEDEKYNEYSLITLMMWLNTILISMALFKCLFYMRVYDKFGNFVLLFSRCVLELIPFTCFLFFWLFGFSVLFESIGIKLGNDDDYLGLSRYFILFIQTFRNNIGDVYTPTYEYWC